MKREDIAKLEAEIRQYDSEYRKGNPLITDREFDEKVEQLKQLDPNSSWFECAVHEETVSNDRKEKLPIPMFSLEKVKTFDEVVKWIKSIGLSNQDDIVITAKYDGISLCVDENKGVAWTRGDGEYGQRCSAHYRQLQNSSWSSIEEDSVTYSYGEAIFKTVEFLKIKENPKLNYKSARNAVAGLINSPTASYLLTNATYVRYGCDREDWDKTKQLDVLNGETFVRRNKVKFGVMRVESLIGAGDEEAFISYTNKIFENLSEGYKCDGIVIEVNDAKKRKELGRLPNGNPRYAIAYKNLDWSEREETIVKQVHWQISKDGRLAPVVEIEPVELCGATVSKCTAYNARYIVENEINEGARVIICRSGDVIPKHLKTLSQSLPVAKMSSIPSICPVCGRPVEWDQNGVDLLCKNKECKGVLLSRCVYFFSTLDFKEFREPTIKKIFDAGYQNPMQIISLNEENLKEIEVLGNVAVKVLSKQFEEFRTKGTNFAKYLTAMNYFGGTLAEKTCQKLLNRLKLYEKSDIFSFIQDVNCDNALDIASVIEKEIEGIGVTTALAFLQGLVTWYEEDFLVPITYYGLEEKSFDGQMMIVFTGFRNKDWENKLTEQGHKIGSSVSKKTTCLVVKEKGSGSTKETKAHSLGIPIFTAEEFKDKFLL